MATPVSTLLPVAATPTVPTIITKAGAFNPENIQQMQSAFQMDYRADVTLSSAQILALFTGAITLVAAPGPGLMLCPETIVMRMIGGTAYTDGGGGAVSFQVGSMTFALTANTIFTASTAGQRSQQIVAFAGTSTAANPPTNENAPLQIVKATGNFAAGTGTMHLTIFYSIETTT